MRNHGDKTTHKADHKAPGYTNMESRPPRVFAISRWKSALVVVLLAITAFGGVLTGRWLVDRQKSSEELARLDEYVGLGKRTGFAGDLQLQINPINFTARIGAPVRLNLKLVNSGTRRLTLNDWFTPTPSELASNQLPFKVFVMRENQKIHYSGPMEIIPAHTRDNFLTLEPGESKDISMEVSRGTGGKEWDMTVPGVYKVEVWYETYLTGKYIGVDAWTGMTNHVVAQVTIEPGR